jgi:cytochrome c peroxidase
MASAQRSVDLQPQRWSARSANDAYLVTAGPESGELKIGALQDWTVTIKSQSGDPVYPARITVGGGMAGHGHGLPTQPQVTAYGGAGDYRMEGVRLSMEGEWTLSFYIESSLGAERADVTFDAISRHAGSGSDWSERERRLLLALALPEDLEAPVSPSNRFADSAAAATLGEALFFDTRFSGDGKLACASCHQPDKYFADGLARSKGMGETLRNAPTLIGSAFNRWFYWDGRRDSLWSQALIPFEASDEMGSSRLGVLRAIAADDRYSQDYESLFGPLPVAVIDNIAAADAGPLGTPAMREAWRVLPLADQKAINEAYANLGKALSAYQRTLLPEPARFDRYVQALQARKTVPENVMLSEDEIAGARLFMSPEKTQCLQCHNGFLGSNGEFHNIGTGNFSGPRLDFGRMFGLRAVLMDEFNCVGPYSDAQENDCAELRFLNKDSHIPLQGSFKTPTLRGLAHTAPYFHDGRFTTLREVLDYYNEPPAPETNGPHELRTLDLSDEELQQLEQFLLTLSP